MLQRDSHIVIRAAHDAPQHMLLIQLPAGGFLGQAVQKAGIPPIIINQPVKFIIQDIKSFLAGACQRFCIVAPDLGGGQLYHDDPQGSSGIILDTPSDVQVLVVLDRIIGHGPENTDQFRLKRDLPPVLQNGVIPGFLLIIQIGLA